LVGKRSVPTFAYVTSVVILRDGKDVASITPFTPATAILDKASLNVTGAISTSSGYLELTWPLPGQEQGGNYTCEVNGIVGAGHNEVLTKSLVMPVEAPSLSQLTSHIHDQEVKLKTQDALIHNLQQQLVNQQQQYTRLEDKISNETDVKIQQMLALIKQQQHQHIENGTVECGASTGSHTDWNGLHLADLNGINQNAAGWTREGNFKVSTVHQTFNTSYSTPPIVRWSISDIKHSSDGSRHPLEEYHVAVVETDLQGFTIQCKIPYNNAYQMYELKLHWTSFPQ